MLAKPKNLKILNSIEIEALCPVISSESYLDLMVIFYLTWLTFMNARINIASDHDNILQGKC